MTAPAALVTGASRGIGRAIARSLAAEGFNVALNSLVDDTELASAVAEVRHMGVTAAGCVADVADVDGHDALLDAAEAAIGPLTTLVNNAGIGVIARGDPLTASVESYDQCQAVNTRAVFFLTQAFARRLIGRAREPERHYSILNISSANAVAASVTRAEYCVSKAAASMITKCFAARLAAEDVNVYEIQPGVIETDMTAPVRADYLARIADGLTLTRRIGQSSEVGAAAAALATGRLAYSTGQVVRVDGGLLLPRF